ncbi:MAG TPA: amidohydrolase family protein [Planctomycetota bacterium]|nr:amidohydrolase family protein [Planctomycetota bacterium]
MIDAHRHFWRYSPASHPWIDDTMPMLKHDFLPGPQILGDPKPDDGCIAVQAMHDLEETRWLLSLAAEHPSVLGVVGWIDLCAHDVTEQLSEFQVHRRFVGVRHLVQDERDAKFLERPDFQLGLSWLAARGLCFDLLLREPQRASAIALVRAFPNQRFVVDHLAKPRIVAGEIDPWHRQIHELARSENVFCKLSGLCTEADWKTWDPSELAPYLDIALESFGPARLIFGSDYPVCTLAGAARRVVKAHLDFLRRLSPTEFRAITHTNAVRVYGLKP